MATKMTLDQMKKFVREHFEDFVNQRKAAVIRKNMTADFYDHDGPGGKPTGVDGDEQMMIAMYKSMPDLHVTIEEMVAEGRQSDVPERLAFHRHHIGPEDAIPWFCAVALRGGEDRRTLGHSHFAPQGTAVDNRSTKQTRAIPPLRSRKSFMSAAAQDD